MAKKTNTTSSKPAKPAAKPAKRALPFAKLFAAAVKNGESSFVVGDGVARHGFASHDRTNGETDASAKREIFEHVVQLLAAGKLDAASNVKALEAWARGKKLVSMKSGKPIKLGTIRSWLGNWKRGVDSGAFYPCDVERKTEIGKLFKKLADKKSK